MEFNADQVTLETIKAALPRIHSRIGPTPLTFSAALSERIGVEIYCKWENKQLTGSFKERGAINFLSQLSEAERKRGVCAASGGNHALALSLHASKMGIPCTIVMPHFAPLVKVEATKKTGAEVVLEGLSIDDSILVAKEISSQRKLSYAPPFDHPHIINGQGSCGVEIVDQLKDFDAVMVCVGGGGLISGVATAIKALKPNVLIYGAQSEWAVSAAKADGAKESVKLKRGTIADGIALKRLGELTKQIIAKTVDSLHVVDEEEIARAIIAYLELEKTVVEGAGAAGLAALLKFKLPSKVRKLVIVVSGSNIDANLLSMLIERDLVKRGRWLPIGLSVPDRPGSLHAVTGIIAKQGANVLHVKHDRFATTLGMVDIGFLLEVRDSAHAEKIKKELLASGVQLLSNVEAIEG